MRIYKKESFISFHMNFVDSGGNHISVQNHGTMKYEIGIMTSFDDVHSSVAGITDFKIPDSSFNGLSLDYFINYSDLNRMMCPNNVLTIVADVIYIEKHFEHPPFIQLSQIMKKTAMKFNDEETSDFTIIASDGEKIHVHRDILSACSVVFNAMLQNSFKESKENSMVVPDVNGKTLIELTRFIYTGVVQNLEGISDELLYAAHKYAIDNLNPLCVRRLFIGLNDGNVLDTLLLADMLSEQNLKNVCFSYLKT